MASRNATAVAWAFAAAPHMQKGPWSVLMVLARRVNKNREDYDVWPGQDTIAEDTGLSIATVKRHLNVLEQGNWLARRPRTAPGRGLVGMTYTLNVVAQFGMPNGRVETVDFYAADEGGRSLKSGGPVAQNEQTRSLTAEPSQRELEKREHKKEESPVVPTGSAQVGLFGDGLPEEPDFADAVCAHFEMQWSRLAEQHERIPTMRTLDNKRRAALLSRVRENIRNSDDIGAGCAVVDELMGHISGSPYLCGEVAPFVVRPDNVLSPSGFLKTMERPYERNGSSFEGPTGRGSSSVVAGARALALVRASRERAAARGEHGPGTGS